MKLTPEERMQGLLDEHAAGLSRTGIKAKCEFFILQGRMTEAEADALLKLIDEREATNAPVSIAEKLVELDAANQANAALTAENATLKTSIAILQAKVVVK